MEEMEMDREEGWHPIERVPIPQRDYEFSADIARYQFSQSFALGRTVLDAACGTGYGTSRLIRSASFAVGLDISDEALFAAGSHNSCPNVVFVKGDAHHVPFPRQSFDLIVSFETIEHVAEPVKFLVSCKQLLKPDGILPISTPNLPLFEMNPSRKPNPYHLREYRPDEFGGL